MFERSRHRRAAMGEEFRGRTAIVTGGASGIGRALGELLASEGARVLLADIDADGARTAATDIGREAEWAVLDVTDARAVRALVEDVAARHGRLDYMFNNAGIVVFGAVHAMALDDWERQIDVNLRGVIHGVAAAYPILMRQGSGHIVNTASAAGIGPAPAAAGYAATKHAVVGLSTSLRAEAAMHGVRVSVVCPGFVDTPIKYRAKILGADRDQILREMPLRLRPVRPVAAAILRGVRRNRPIIVINASARIGWWLYRLSPRLFVRLVQAGYERSPFARRS
jgi:NAD(P)-dependent dehydrogenase (short-subunit alcohol dehydrogenase family)